MAKTQMAYFVTVEFYNKRDKLQIDTLRGYYDEIYAQAVCDRLMKYKIDRDKWMVACETYLNAHPELAKIPMRYNQYPQTRRKLRAEWESANPFTSIAEPHDNTYSVTEVPVKVATTAYRVYEQGKYKDTETTLGTFWSSDEAEAFKNEHNRYAKEWNEWIRESFEHADLNPELIEKRSERQALGVKLAVMSEADAEYAALEKRGYELLVLISAMVDNLCNMWKANNPFQSTALRKNEEAFIETLTVQ